MLRRLIVYLKLTIVFVTIGQGESYDVASGVGDVEDYAVGRWGGLVLRVTAKGSFYLDLDLAKVLQEDHSKGVAINGGLNGKAFVWCTDRSVFFYFNRWNFFFTS